MLPFWGLLVIFFALNIMDYGTTYRALTLFEMFEGEGATAHEKNPIARWVLNEGGGLAGLAWLKVTGMIVLMSFFSHLPYIALVHATWPLIGINTMMAFVVVNNLNTIRRIRNRYNL